jgi:RNA polymerase sigma-70 factor (family 1)
MLKGVPASEESAFAKFKEGNEEGLAILFRNYYPVLVVFACKYISNDAADEIVNEAFYKVWEKRHLINSLSHFRSYLYKIVYHDCLKAKRSTTLQTIDNADEPVDDFDYSAEVIKSETLRLLYQAIDTLPAQCKQVFTHLYVEGKTVRETADEMGIAVSTVKAQKARGLILLKTRLANVEMGVLLLLSSVHG